MTDLPNGWMSASIEDTGQYINGLAFKPTDWKEVGTPIIRIKNLTDPEAPINRTTRTVPDSVKVTKGTILVSWSATLDAFIWNREDAVLNQHIFKVIPDERVVWKSFLYYLLRSEIAVMRDSDHLHGSTMKHINRGPFLAHKIALPPLAEQKRIAGKLEAVLGRVDDCRARLDRVPDLLKRFRQSVLAAATSGQLTEDWREENHSNEWQKKKLTELGELGRGKSKHRPRNDPRLYGGPYPFIQTGDVANSGGRITTHSQTYSEFGLAQSRLWPSGTVCITIAANIADTAILGYEACFPDSVVGFVANPKECLPEFIKWTVDVIKDDLEAFAPATAQKNINLGVLYEVDLLIPPLPEQAEIVRRVEALFALADRIEARLATAQRLVERLTPATLSKAFRGDLVPQDPNDEPASKLLERLQSATAPKTSRKRQAN